MSFVYKNKVLTTADYEQFLGHNAESISSAFLQFAKTTFAACCHTSFADRAMSDKSKNEKFWMDDDDATGEAIGHSMVRNGSDNWISTVSLNANTISINVGKKDIYNSLLKTGYTIEDVKKLNKVMDEQLEQNDYYLQITVDASKNGSSLSEVVDVKTIVPVRHESDIIKHSGEKEYSYRNAEGKLITKYKADWRLSDKYADKFVDRSKSNAPDMLLVEAIKESEDLAWYFKPVDCDEQGVTIYRITERGLNKIKPAELDKSKLILPGELYISAIPSHNFDAWNHEGDGIKVDKRKTKDLTKWDLVDLFYELYDSHLNFDNDEDDRRRAFEYAMSETGKLIASVTMQLPSREQLFATINNVFVTKCVPNDLNCGFEFDEDGHVTNPEHEFKFERSKFIDFKKGVELFGEVWANMKDNEMSFAEKNALQKEQELLALEKFVASKKHKSSEDGTYTNAIFDDAELAAIDV